MHDEEEDAKIYSEGEIKIFILPPDIHPKNKLPNYLIYFVLIIVWLLNLHGKRCNYDYNLLQLFFSFLVIKKCKGAATTNRIID